MTKQLLFSFTLLLFFLFHSATTSAQSPAKAPTVAAAAPTKAAAAPTATAATPTAAAAAPTTITLAPTQPAAPAGKIDIIKILNNAGHFTLLTRLLKSTQVGDQINRQLKGSHQRLTLFAPGDGAFSSLQTGTLNSLTDGQQVQLLLFHVLPSFLSTNQFQTLSNPLRTEAGSTGAYDYPLNLTTNAANQANVSTGVVNATIAQTLYSDNQLAVYEVDKVLLPMSIFGPPAPAPAPAPKKAKKAKAKAKALELAPEAAAPQSKPKTELSPAASSTTTTTSTTTSSDDTASAAAGLTVHEIYMGVALIAAAVFM